jgi:xanthine/uracil/vitamin C permease (AzgA family)
MSDSAAQDAQDKADIKNVGSASSKLFDLRFLIGGLFTLYGVMVGVAGLLDTTADLRKSNGLKINLWAGIFMLILGLLFLLWAFLRPVQHPTKDDGST